MENRLRGVLLGLAAGDHNGGPIQMAVRLAESLGTLGRYDKSDMTTRYLNWFLGPPHDESRAFDTGSTFHSVFTYISKGCTVDEAVQLVHKKYDSAGINAAHRSVAIACLGTLSSTNIIEISKQESSITHIHPLSMEAAVAHNLILRSLIEGKSLSEAVESAEDPTITSTQEIRKALKSAILPTGSRPKNPGGFSPDVLQAAIYFAKFPNEDFETALENALGFAGPANFCPVLTGALLGAKFGADAIPASALRHVKPSLKARIDRVNELLVKTWNLNRD